MTTKRMETIDDEFSNAAIDWTDNQVKAGKPLLPAQAIVAKYLESFKEFPPRAKAASFSVNDVMDKITTAKPNQD